MANKNQDYYKTGGRGGGPVGPRSQHKSLFSQERAILDRDQERVLGGERPLSGRRPAPGHKPMGAVEEAEAQLASVHGEAERPSVLDSLPRPTGTVGVPRSAKSVVGALPTEEREEEEGVEAGEEGTWNLEPRESEAPYGFGIPASEDAALGHEREPFAREEGEMRHAAREVRRPHVPPLARRAMRTFPSLVRLMGDVARAVDRPIRRTLETLQQLGDEVRKPS